MRRFFVNANQNLDLNAAKPSMKLAVRANKVCCENHRARRQTGNASALVQLVDATSLQSEHSFVFFEQEM